MIIDYISKQIKIWILYHEGQLYSMQTPSWKDRKITELLGYNLVIKE